MPPGQAATIQREQFEVVAQRAVGVVVAKRPAFAFGSQHSPDPVLRRKQRQIAGEQYLSRTQLFDGRPYFGWLQLRHPQPTCPTVPVPPAPPSSVSPPRHQT